MAKKQQVYETTFIVNASLDDPQIDAVVEKAKEVITKHGGEIMELTKWGRKRFAYPIKKKNNGFYVLCEFTSAGDLVPRLERHFLLDENIIRFLLIALDKKALQARISGNDLMKQAAPPAANTSVPLSVDAFPVEEPDALIDPLIQSEA